MGLLLQTPAAGDVVVPGLLHPTELDRCDKCGAPLPIMFDVEHVDCEHCKTRYHNDPRRYVKPSWQLR